MVNDFCRYLSNSYQLHSNGRNLTYSPCCFFNGKRLDVLADDFVTKKLRISEISDWTPECSHCANIEQHSVYDAQKYKSPRIASFEKIPDGIIDDSPVRVELLIDITCNAACIMCGPSSSTTWRKQNVKFGITNFHDVPDIINPLDLFNKFRERYSLSNIVDLHFLGGEPLLTDTPRNILMLIKEEKRGDLSDVIIHFTTNATVKPRDSLLELLSECKQIIFHLSIDGVENRFEYIRYPLRWKTVNNTIDYILNLGIVDCSFRVTSTVNPLNIFYYNDLEQWVVSKFGNNPRYLVGNACTGVLSLNKTPPLLRDVIMDKYGAEHEITKLLNAHPYTDNSASIFPETMDKFRKTNWRLTFPDVVQYFDYN